MFYLTEFMAYGPVKPRPHVQMLQPATLSLLERALTQESEREAEPDGVGH